jgi:hypothetical protein
MIQKQNSTATISGRHQSVTGAGILPAAVTSADSPGASAETKSGVAIHALLVQHRSRLAYPLAESARLMPVNASPIPAHAGALAGIMS